MTHNQAGINIPAGTEVDGGAIDASGCTYATPLAGTPLPRTQLRISDTSFTANAALGPDAFGGAIGTGLGVSTLLTADSFTANSDSCSKDGALYINLFSSDDIGCTDTLSVQAELAPPCDAWAPLGVIHEEAGSTAADTRQTCVPLQPAKDAAFCCAPSAAAPALVCPLAPPLPTDVTCAVGGGPREAAPSASKAAGAFHMARAKAQAGPAME